jgi:Zn ribbon nucleic-acid-binding protein
LKRLTTNEFIEKAIKIHGNNYSYLNVDYLNSISKISITCNIHGDFFQIPNYHLSGHGCPKCGIDKLSSLFSSNTSEFIQKATLIHDSLYTYDTVNYVSSGTKVSITCNLHGDFFQTPASHLSGRGCPKCGRDKRALSKTLTTHEFIEKAIKIHGNVYYYLNVVYLTARSKISITCNIHGDFLQTPNSHLSGHGCPKCGKDKLASSLSSNTSEFIEKANQIHGNKYSYLNVNYTNSDTKVSITCNLHGDFLQTPEGHLSGAGCPRCGMLAKIKSLSSNTSEFIQKATLIHDSLYTYENVNYISSGTKVSITCNLHGDFSQIPESHLSGAGCPACKSSKGEKLIYECLAAGKIAFQPQYSFPDCKYVLPLRYDFGIFDNDTIIGLIEFNGIQHYKAIEYFGGKESLLLSQQKDEIKQKYCKDNDIPLLIIPYWEKHKIPEIIHGWLMKCKKQN